MMVIYKPKLYFFFVGFFKELSNEEFSICNTYSL